MSTPTPMALEHLWGALVGLIAELTKLAKNANQTIDDERKAGKR